MVGEAEWNVLQRQGHQLRDLQRNAPQLVADLRRRMQADLVEVSRRLNSRQRAIERAMNALSDQAGALEAETNRRLREQAGQLESRLAETAGRLRGETNAALAEQQRAWRAEMTAERDWRRVELSRLREMRHLQAHASAEAVRVWLSDAVLLRDLIRDQLPHERYASGQLAALTRRLAVAEENARQGRLEAALALAQQSYHDLSDLRVEIELQEREWTRLRTVAYEALLELDGLAAQNANQMIDVGAFGNEAAIDLDVDYWSEGELRELRSDLADLTAQVSNAKNPPPAARLRQVIDDLVPELERLLTDVTQRALLRLVASQSRVNIADVVVQALDDIGGYQLADHGYEEMDERRAFFAKLLHPNGNEIVVSVAASADESDKSVLRVLSYDDGTAAEADSDDLAAAVTRELRTRGFDAGDPGREPGEAVRVYPDIRQIRETGVACVPDDDSGIPAGVGTVGELPDRYLTGALPEQAPAGRRISLIVQVTRAVRPGGSALIKPLDVPPQGLDITITVTAPGLVSLGDLEQDLHVPAAGDSEPIRFGFMTGRAGLHSVTLRAFVGGTFLAELALEVSVEVGASLEEGPPRFAALDGLASEPGEVTLQVSRTDGDRYSFQLIGEALYPVELTRRLAGDPAEVVQALVDELRAMAAQESPYASPALVRKRIRSLGAQLWADVVPEAIRRQFWDQAGRIRLFTVASDMDTVPWELLYPIDGDNDNGFLVEQFPVVRRVYGQGRARRLSLSSAAYIVPPGAPANAMDEVQAVRARLGADIRHYEVCSRLDSLIGLLDASPSVLHFACHNAFADKAGSVISLDGGPLHPSDLTPVRQARSMAASSPLVFLNVCRTAGEIPGLTEMMGWARQFMGAGAGAFIGSLWAVRSRSAMTFADTFYHALVAEGAPLGEASLRARQAIAADEGDPTWLAYTIYGNPSATIQ